MLPVRLFRECTGCGSQPRALKTAELPLEVRIGNITNGNVKLDVGDEKTLVKVEVGRIPINTDQAIVQEVFNSGELENFPLNGRNFLDIAQLEPGVQILDGVNIDPTKAGYFSISFDGHFGRITRTELDGVDVSDETVGASTENIPVSAIREFSAAQSNLDLSNELSATGAINLVTKSGTDSYHGELFGIFRDHGIASASLTHAPSQPAPYFQRNQDGVSVGGPILKDKLFFFGDGERTVQHLQAPVVISGPFSVYSGSFPSPFTEDNVLGRVDYEWNPAVRLFGRLSYFKNSDEATFFPSSFQLYDNRNVTRNAAFGANFSRGDYTHSIRASYLKFDNHLLDATAGTSLPFANSPVSINFNSFSAGPNFAAPQSTAQSDYQITYDGSRVMGNTSFISAQTGTTSKWIVSPHCMEPTRCSWRRTIYPGCAGAQKLPNCPLGSGWHNCLKPARL